LHWAGNDPWLDVLTGLTDTSITGLCWIANFRPMLEQGAIEPDWGFDVASNDYTTLGILFEPQGTYLSMRPFLAMGIYDVVNAHAYVKEISASNTDDDGDAWGKRWVVASPHYFFGDQSGDDNQGSTFGAFDLFL